MNVSVETAPIHVRSCEVADMDAETPIYAHHVLHGTGSFETEPPDTEEMRRRRADILARELPYLVTETGGHVVGYAYATAYRPRAAYRDTVENSVYVHPERMARGIGRTLLAPLIAACEACALRQMVAVVGDSANVASVRLHEGLGFRMVGVLRAVGFKQCYFLHLGRRMT